MTLLDREGLWCDPAMTGKMADDLERRFGVRDAALVSCERGGRSSSVINIFK